MAINKRRVAGVIFSMILTTNVLCTELSHAQEIILQAKQMHKLKTMVPYQSSTHGNSDEECTRAGDYCFAKQSGCVPDTDEDIIALLHVNASLNVKNCMDACKRYLCTAFLVFNLSFGTYNPPPACIFFLTMPKVIEDSLWSFDIYIHKSKASSPSPAPAILLTLPPEEKAPNPADQPREKEKPVKHWWIWLLGAIPPVIAMCFLVVAYYSRTKTDRNSKGVHELQDELGKGNSLFTLQTQTTSSCIPRVTLKLDKPEKLGDEFQIFRLKSIRTATNQFSGENKLGEGGFGPVYKASLLDGQEVAVKRLSRSSSQGLGEFKNEIKLIAKLQHMNLVKLLGCCLEENEKMLVYEFLPNRSLDSFLFDPTKKKQLDWKKRLDIIEGIAQGLLYLHKHSRLKVIHRDLKTSNVLLDRDLKPKISDFGIARIFEQNASEASTKRVVGTYGYMSPEYAMAGLYSEKSDVFSFGVIVLEIMSGRKVTSFSGVEDPLNLIRYAWDLWKEDQSSELIDQGVSEIYNTEELVRHIHVGLLCVEERVGDRPTMSDVLLMLTNTKMPLPAPKQPAFYCGNRKIDIVVQHQNETKTCSPNLVTLSPVEGR